MENDKKTITPNEINKFCYCPYQWYYERYYGKNILRQRVKERNQLLGINNKTKSNFIAGNNHHKNIHIEYKRKIAILKIIFIVFLVLMIYIVWCFLINM